MTAPPSATTSSMSEEERRQYELALKLSLQEQPHQNGHTDTASSSNATQSDRSIISPTAPAASSSATSPIDIDALEVTSEGASSMLDANDNSQSPVHKKRRTSPMPPLEAGEAIEPPVSTPPAKQSLEVSDSPMSIPALETVSVSPSRTSSPAADVIDLSDDDSVTDMPPPAIRTKTEPAYNPRAAAASQSSNSNNHDTVDLTSDESKDDVDFSNIISSLPIANGSSIKREGKLNLFTGYGADASIDLTDDDVANHIAAAFNDAQFEYDEEEEQASTEADVKYGVVSTNVVQSSGPFNFSQNNAEFMRVGAKVFLHCREIHDNSRYIDVRLSNQSGTLIGQLPPYDVLALFDLIRTSKIRTLTEISGLGMQGMTVRIQVYGKARYRFDTESILLNSVNFNYRSASDQFSNGSQVPILPISSAGGGGMPLVGAPHLPNAHSVAVEREKHLERLFARELDLTKLPPLPDLSAIIPTQLKHYQADGVRWALYREGVPMLGNDPATKNQRREQKKDVALCRGGILADEMGLGKTLQCLTLIVADYIISAGAATDGSTFKPPPTLIVCPVSVISNWQQQMQDHYSDTAGIKVYTYHGPGRKVDAEELSSFDVVITTYSTLSQEFVMPDEPVADDAAYTSDQDDSLIGATSSPMFHIAWRRVILDEAHNIRTVTARQSRAVCALKAERRWAATGTPLQNKIEDIYGLFKFLRVAEFSQRRVFSSVIATPIKHRLPSGTKVLAGLLAQICLRRTKDEEYTDPATGLKRKLLELPPKANRILYVELTGFERELHEKLKQTGLKSFKALQAKGGRELVMKSMAHILEMLLRMRQSCDHSSLVPSMYYEHGFDLAKGKLDPQEEQRRLLDLLEDGSTNDCFICGKEVDDPVITSCAHIFCRKCITAKITQAESRNGASSSSSSSSSSSGNASIIQTTFGAGGAVALCPIDQVAITKADLLSLQDGVKLEVKAELADQEQKREEDHSKLLSKRTLCMGLVEALASSAKIDALIHEMELADKKDPTSKAVVFSQWTSFMNILEGALLKRKIRFVRLDGSVEQSKRAEAIDAFQNNPRIKVFLISLKAGGVGLNLTAANQAFLMDIWWNPHAEDQAVDRIHRLGQTRAVDVVRIIAANTVEQRVEELQQKKREMASAALEGRKKGGAGLDFNDIAHLFGANNSYGNANNGSSSSSSSSASNSFNLNNPANRNGPPGAAPANGQRHGQQPASSSSSSSSSSNGRRANGEPSSSFYDRR